VPHERKQHECVKNKQQGEVITSEKMKKKKEFFDSFIEKNIA